MTQLMHNPHKCPYDGYVLRFNVVTLEPLPVPPPLPDIPKCTDAGGWECPPHEGCANSELPYDLSANAVTFINTGNFTCNAVLNATSVEGLSANQKGYVTSNCRGLFR